MKIKSLQVGNFGCYKGINHPIIFSTDNHKNVTVILGANKSGKTTLIHAFLWCLYGTKMSKLDLVNTEVKAEMADSSALEMFVEIVLIHANREYTIRRTQQFSKANGYFRSQQPDLKVYYKEKSGEQQAVLPMDCQDTVDNILPQDLSDYFFYEGERFVDISKKDVATAVKGLMGLDAISAARVRFDPKSAKSVTSRLRDGLKLVQNDTEKSANLREKLSKSQEKLDTIEERLENAKKEQSYYEDRKIELETELNRNASSKKLQSERKKLESHVGIGEKNIKASTERILSDFRQGALPFFAQPLIDKALSVIENSNQDGEGIPEMRQAAIDHILDRGRCICGCDLGENEGARKRILAERSLLPPEHLGTILHNHKQTLIGFQTSSRGFVQKIESSYATWRENVRVLERTNEEFDKICKEISSTESVDVSKIESLYQDNNSKLRSVINLREKLLTDKGYVERGIADCAKQIESLVSKTDQNAKIQHLMLYAAELFEMFDQSYSRREKEVKSNISESVNRIFSEMYHGRRIVEIDDNYQIKLLTTVGSSQEELADTGGLRAVKNFAYITGLVDIARKRVAEAINSEDSDEYIGNTTEPYPLIMDAPFSATDETHINNISRIVPNIAEQVIIIVMQKDWAYAKETIGDRVGKSYVIENINNSETHSAIREAQ